MIDVCLVVEGSYPYVTGGVSAWTHGLIRALPDVRYTVAHVRDAGDPDLPAAYALPANANLVHVDRDPDEPRPQVGLHLDLPEARVYHAACTGAAGELARLAAAEHGAAFALTEHGIAWREARWGIEGCRGGVQGCRGGVQGCRGGVQGCRGGVQGCRGGVQGCRGGVQGCRGGVHGCRGGVQGETRVWTLAEQRERADAILAMAMESYAHADAVTSVCGPNVLAQRALGAAASYVIPNAAPTGPVAEAHDGFLVGFVGRVVEVKDVETFVRACAAVAERRADASFVVVGPTHHEPEYAQACVELAAELGLGERITFTGTADPRPWYARMDVLALTSLSEAQPLVALEAMAAGVPVVATDVGGCREAIADAGLITRAEDPAGTARALLRLADDELLRARLGAAGRRLAAARHDPARVHGAYHELYERLAA